MDLLWPYRQKGERESLPMTRALWDQASWKLCLTWQETFCSPSLDAKLLHFTVGGGGNRLPRDAADARASHVGRRTARRPNRLVGN